MKRQHVIVALAFGSLFILGSVSANATDLLIKGKQARQLYNSLTGPAVQHDGAAGHLFSKGKSILCRFTDVDMTVKGKPVPATAPSRYVCSMTFNHNGLAAPGPNP